MHPHQRRQSGPGSRLRNEEISEKIPGPGRERRSRELSAVCLTGFSLVARFHRTYGACFLKNLDSASVRNVRSDDSTKYLCYHIILWLSGLGTMILTGALVRSIYLMVSRAGQVNVGLVGVFAWTTYIEGYVNAYLMRKYRRQWLLILRKCEWIEDEIGANIEMTQSMKIAGRRVLLLQSCIIIFNMSINYLNEFSFGVIRNEEAYHQVTLVQWSFAVFCSTVAGYQIPSNSTVSRIWMMYFGQLFNVYVRRIHEELRTVLSVDGVKMKDKIDVCDRMRICLTQVREVAQELSDVIGLAVFYGYTTSVPLLCIASYFISLQDVVVELRAFFAVFAFAHILSIAIPTLVSTINSGEMASLKQTIEQASGLSGGPSLSSHLALLERAADVQDYRIDAFGFFKVDLPLLTVVTGVVTTYTVMLVQINAQRFAASDARTNVANLHPGHNGTIIRTLPGTVVRALFANSNTSYARSHIA